MTTTDRIKVKVKGTVSANFRDAETGKTVIYIDVTPKAADTLETLATSKGLEWDNENFPVKYRDDDTVYVKASTKYEVKIDDPDIELTDIGKGSVITAYLVIKEGTYGKRKRYVSAFLTGVEIHEFVQLEEYNPFTDDEFASTDLEAE